MSGDSKYDLGEKIKNLTIVKKICKIKYIV